MTTKDRYPNETPAITRHRRLRRVGDFDFVPDDSAVSADEILRRASYGPVWADPSPTEPCVTDTRQPAAAPQPASVSQPADPPLEQFTHRCTSCAASVTTAQSLLPRCPSCGAGAT